MINSASSPFFVVEEFISPLACEAVIDLADFTSPNYDKEGVPVRTIKTNDKVQEIIYERLVMLMPELEKHYNVAYKGTLPIEVEWCPEGSAGIEPHAENSVFVRSKWLRTQAKDLTGVIFLCDYQKEVPFEREYEVYGGKLEFPQHQFGFNPQRGTLVIFPSAPHFINNTAAPLVGDLYQIRFHISSKLPFLYQPQNFPGNYTTWFKT
jgi:hypothetical protein